MVGIEFELTEGQIEQIDEYAEAEGLTREKALVEILRLEGTNSEIGAWFFDTQPHYIVSAYKMVESDDHEVDDFHEAFRSLQRDE